MASIRQRSRRRLRRHDETVAADFAAHPRMPGRIYKTGRGYALDVPGQPSVDAGAMKASAVINTINPDRDSEIIVPTGGRWENYTANPVVLWEHGLDPNVSKPIAKCRTPEGELAVQVFQDHIEADSFFTNRERDSEQIFALIDEEIVNATSIHVDPLPGKAESINRGGQRVVVFNAWEMLEWSWGCIGVNPEAVRKVLDRNTLAGGKISESIAKSLWPMAARAKVLGRGWAPEDGPEQRGSEGLSTTDEGQDMSANELVELRDTVAKMKRKMEELDESSSEAKLRKMEAEVEKLRKQFGTSDSGVGSGNSVPNKPAGEPPTEDELVTKAILGKAAKALRKMEAMAEPPAEEVEAVKSLLKAVEPATDDQVEAAKALRKQLAKIEEELPISTSDSTVGGGSGKRYDVEAIDKTEGEPADPAAAGPPVPASAQALAAFHSTLKEQIAGIQASLAVAENPDVKKFLEAEAEAITAKMTEVEGLYGSTYPEAPALSSEAAPPDEEAMKSWLSGGGNRKLQLSGHGQRLKAIASRHRPPTPREWASIRQQIGGVYKHLHGVIATAGQATPAETTNKELEAKVERLEGLLAAALPHRR